MPMEPKRKVYLDYNATTPTHPEVLEAMSPFFIEKFGNPSSLHQFGRETRKYIEESREKVAKLINSSPDEIYFTSGGTESNNFAIKGIAYAYEEKGKHIITSQVEHHAVLEVCKYLEKRGFKITYLPVDNYGMVDPKDVEKAITKETTLITIMHANNEVGTIMPIKEISEIAKKYGVIFHTDAVQTVGKIKVDVKELGVDLLSLSAHKFYGPKGIGALYIKNGINIHSLIHGGAHERNKRAGTENLPGIVGLGKACEIALRDIDDEYTHMKILTQRLKDEILNKIPNTYLNGHPEKRIPNTLNITFEYVEGEALLTELDLKGIAVSSGSACSSASLEPSHVLKAMKIDLIRAQSSVRFSLGRYTTSEDIDYVIEVLPSVIERLRAISPLTKT